MTTSETSAFLSRLYGFTLPLKTLLLKTLSNIRIMFNKKLYKV